MLLYETDSYSLEQYLLLWPFLSFFPGLLYKTLTIMKRVCFLAPNVAHAQQVVQSFLRE